MADLGWARSKEDRAERDGLRRGAWYRVVEDKGQSWVVLDVHHVEVRIPKDDVDLRGDRPTTWSVVRAPYLVCPGCHVRRYVPGQVKESKCPECGNTYKVDWSDRA